MSGSISLDDLRDKIAIRHGTLRSGATTLFSIMRDESFILPAFFDHYRGLGVDQFLILDDGSRDGTETYLRAQPDCVVLSSDLGFGERVSVTFPDGTTETRRWGIVAKSLIPRIYLANEYALYVDADEFLLAPPGVDLPRIIEVMAERGGASIAASLIEFYPETMGQLDGLPRIETLTDLLGHYPHFDAVPLVSVSVDGKPAAIGASASERLFRTYGIGKGATLGSGGVLAGLARRIVQSATAQKEFASTPRLKTPLAHWTDAAWLRNSHIMSTPAMPEAVLAFAHFKFTHVLADRIRKAMEWKSYSGNSAKYKMYAALLEKGDGHVVTLLGPQSTVYKTYGQLEEIGLARWPFDEPR